VAVRVKVRVKFKGRSRDLVVLVNGGAESDEPVIATRPNDIKELQLNTNDFELVEVELASGITHNLISRDKVTLELLDEKGNVLSSTKAYIALDEDLTEPLITDATIDELGIQVISFKKGLWRHAKDRTKIRRSFSRL